MKRLFRARALFFSPLIVLGFGLFLLGVRSLSAPGRADALAVEATPPSPEPSPAARVDANDEELVFSEKEVNLGLVKKEVEHTFHFQNRANREVKIVGIQKTCTCMMTHTEKKSLQPGEKGFVTVKIEPREGKLGPQLYMVTIDYEGDRKHQARLAVKAYVRRNLEYPAAINLSVTRGKPASSHFRLLDFRPTAIVINQVRTSCKELVCEISERPTNYLPGWQYGFRVGFAVSGMSTGQRAEIITLETSDPQNPTIAIPVIVTILPRIRVGPSTLTLTHPLSAGTVGKIIIDDREGEAVEIESATVVPDNKLFSLTYDKAPGARKVAQLRFSGTDGALPSVGKEFSIRIRLSQPIAEELWVKVIGP